MSNAAPSKALVKVTEIPTHPLARVEELRAAFEGLRDRFNILCPVAQVDHLMPLHQASLRAVMIDTTVDGYGNGPEVYRDPRFCAKDEVALGKNALAKLMAAAGVQVVSKQRLDDRSDPNYCELEVALAVRDFDGSHRQVIATKEMDLRPGAPETMKPEKDSQGNKTGRLVPYEDTALADKRRHIQSHAETKAIERGLRLLFALRQKYKLADLARPFVVPKLVPALDPNDPETKTALIHHALAGETALFGAPRSLPTRTLREVPPPAEARSAATAPAVEPETAALDAEEASPEDFEVPDLTPAEPIVCACPCGDQVEISEAVAAATTEKVGAPRCAACFPGKRFDYERHKDLRTLGLPKHPKLTAADVRAALARGGARS
jgi:hypothetical protein